ncbi:hypothetical protein [Williamsia sp. R60]
MAAVLPADQGADVICIEPVEGPRWPDPAAETLARGKRRERIDLSTPSGAARAREHRRSRRLDRGTAARRHDVCRGGTAPARRGPAAAVQRNPHPLTGAGPHSLPVASPGHRPESRTVCWRTCCRPSSAAT